MVEKERRRGIADMTALAPILYGLDNRYYGVGAQIGVGYAEGEGYRLEGSD